jgi:hypothetical protein
VSTNDAYELSDAEKRDLIDIFGNDTMTLMRLTVG